MTYQPDLTSEYVTGDQPDAYRMRRGALRYPPWRDVEAWRDRWTAEKVQVVLHLLDTQASAGVIGKKTGFGILSEIDDHGQTTYVPDLRGLDLALLSPEERHSDVFTRPLDLSYGRLEGARLIDLNLCEANLIRTKLQKATLRRTNFEGANLTKAHLEDADMRDAMLDDARLGYIRYTEDGFWWRGTVLMETHLRKALYVDPLLERCAKDQSYLYVLKYTNRRNPIFRVFFFLWWITCNYGKSAWMWASWSIGFALGFATLFFWLGQSHFSTSNLEFNFQTMIYYSVVTFTTLGFGDVVPKTQLAAWCVTAEVITGYIMLGGLISILSTKIARRS